MLWHGTYGPGSTQVTLTECIKLDKPSDKKKNSTSLSRPIHPFKKKGLLAVGFFKIVPTSSSHSLSRTSLLSYLGDEKSQEDADSNLHGRFNFSRSETETDSRLGDRGWISSAHNSTVQAPERERRGKPFAVSRRLPTSPKYNCSLISKALDGGAETTTNRFMRRMESGGRRRR